MKRQSRTRAALVGVTLLASVLTGVAKAEPAAAQDGLITAEMVQLIESGGSVQVSIEFEAGVDANTEVPTRISSVERSRAELLPTLARDVRVIRQYRTISSVSAEVSSLAALQALDDNPLVKSVVVELAGVELGFQEIEEESATEMMDQVRTAIEVDQFHALNIRGQGSRVAMVDSGVDAAHPALDHAIVGEWCFVSLSNGGCPNGRRSQSGAGAAVDASGHGTLVAGTIVSDGTGSAPVGVAPLAKLEVFKTWNAGSGIIFADVAAALDHIVATRPLVQVVNLSVGTESGFPGNCSRTLHPPVADAIASLRSRGVLVVAAAGNEGHQDRMSFPACLGNAFSVTATTTATNPTLASFANISLSTDVAAPGTRITTTARGGGVNTVDGTSFSTPITAGCAALLIQSGIIEAAALSSRLTMSNRTASGQYFTVPFLNCAPQCAGRFVTVNIPAGDVPTASADVILGSSAGETINALGGDDVVCAGGGNDIVNGGGGDDTIYGQSGHDTLTGGAGDDTISGSNGNDIIDGNVGRDELIGGNGNDIIDGGGDDDEIFGRDGSDKLSGGAGDDEIYGEAGYDKIYGGPGNDYLSGGAQLDKILGEAGDDTIVGDGDNDLLLGGDGNDMILGAAGADDIYGQVGDDILRGNGGNDRIHGDQGNDTLIGSAGNDMLYGRDGDDKLYGRSGNDRLYGEAGTDILFGEAGNDLLSGGPGVDTCNGGAGADTLIACP